MGAVWLPCHLQLLTKRQGEPCMPACTLACIIPNCFMSADEVQCSAVANKVGTHSLCVPLLPAVSHSRCHMDNMT